MTLAVQRDDRGVLTLTLDRVDRRNALDEEMLLELVAAFDAAAEEDVTSPTFTLVHEYRGPRVNVYHIDLYRVDTARELETLGLDDLRSGNSLLLIEWGEKFPRLVRERDVEIAIEHQGADDRVVTIKTQNR